MKLNRHKFTLFRRLEAKLNSRSGIILFVVLWTLVILTALAVSLGRHANIEMAMLKHDIGKVQSKYLAWAGINYVLEHIYADSLDDKSKQSDTLYYCGVAMDEQLSLEEIFRNKELDSGYFVVQYPFKDEEGQAQEYFGFKDEERLININATTTQNVYVLKSLMSVLGIEDESAWTVAYSVVDWIDPDSNPSDMQYGAEEEHYKSLSDPYQVKNRPLDSKEELLLVKGVDRDIYNKIKDYITIYPKEGTLKINFDTADKIVLQALAWSLTGPTSNTDQTDANSLVDKMLAYRSGNDQIENTVDDQQIDFSDMPINSKEMIIHLVMNQFRTKTSDYFRIRVTGVEQRKKIATHIDAIVNREDLKIVAWKRK